MEKFETYKNDWNYPIYLRKAFTANSAFIGNCVTFQKAMKITLITGQCFGLNPVLGICQPDASKLRFTFRSWRCLYTLISIVAQFTSVLFCILKMIYNDASLGSNSNTIFYLTNSCTTIIFLRIAMKWPKLCAEISKTETADPNMDTGLSRKCNMSCVIILTFALIEHTLSDITGIAVVLECNPDTNIFEAFTIKSFPWLWMFISYNYVFGFIALLLNLQCTFNWNFADLFVICVSMYLTSRFEQVNQRINAVKNKYVPSSFWRTMREDYNRIACLVRLVDEIIGGVVFLSFANNLFFICVQLLHTLADGIKEAPRCHVDGPDSRPFRGYEQAVYFVFSFGFLLLRWLAVSMIASKVHTASKAPATALYFVSSSTYCVEIQRFLDQIHGDNISLSGLQFFNVKRGLVLSGLSLMRLWKKDWTVTEKAFCLAMRYCWHQFMLHFHRVRFCKIAGTIVTYELVLMQFTGISPTSAPI